MDVLINIDLDIKPNHINEGIKDITKSKKVMEMMVLVLEDQGRNWKLCGHLITKWYSPEIPSFLGPAFPENGGEDDEE